jgi:hypothetical protein
MGVLNRPAMIGQAFPNVALSTLEPERDQPWMLEDLCYVRSQRTELQLVARAECGRLRAVLGSGPKIALSKRDRNEIRDVGSADVLARRKPNLDAGTGPPVPTRKARGNCRRIVRNDHVIPAQ